MISKNTVSIRAFLVIAIILPTFALLWLVKPDEPISYEYNAKLGDLAYGIPSSLGYTVYIEESEGYQPYYVLTNSYNGQGGTALLLRKYILNDLREFESSKSTDSYRSYYEHSSIDQFLNSDFLETLAPTVQQHILDSTITIADRAAITSLNHATLEIVRKVFLPSMTELGFGAMPFLEPEGKPIKDVANGSKDVVNAISPTGETGDWWTRSPTTHDRTQVWVISAAEGSGSNNQTHNLFGVRPAFCLSGDLPVKTAEVAPGTTGYVLDWDAEQPLSEKPTQQVAPSRPNSPKRAHRTR